MKNRTDAYNSIYLPYVEKLLGGKVLQNILVTGVNGGSIKSELKRHENLNYEHMFHFETMLNYESELSTLPKNSIIQDNIFSPRSPIESVNLIFFDGQWFDDFIENQQPKNLVKNLTSGVRRVIDNGFKNNKLGTMVILYSDCIGIDNWVEDSDVDYRASVGASLDTYEGIEIPFHLLKQNYGNYRVEDFFHKKFSFENESEVIETSLSGAVFYEG